MSMPGIPTSSYPEHRLEGADHLACMYRCELERREVLVSFLRPALEIPSDAAMVSSPLLAQPVIDSLRRQNLPVAERLRWAHLGRTGLRLLGPNPGQTAAETVLAMLAGRGHPREYARVAMDVAFVLGLSPSLRDTQSFVCTTGDALERAGVIALFLYNAAGFEPEVLLEMFAVHKRIAIGSLVHDNPYHCPEPGGANSRFRALLLDTCMQNLVLDWTAPTLLAGVLEAQPKPPAQSLSEAHCALIIDRSADGIVLIDTSGRVVLANRAAGQLLGRPTESILGQWFGFPLVSEGTVEIDLVRPDGEPRTAEMRVAEIPWRGRRVLLASLRDTTERRIAEQALRRSEANFRALTEASPDAIVVHRNGMIAYVNPACLRLFGYETRTMLLGRPVLDLIHAEDRPRVQAMLETLRHDQGPYPPTEQRFQRKDGGEVMLEVVTVPVTYEDQRAFVAIARDLTERNRMASHLAQADKMASLGTLASGVAHEINNPLTYVMWSLDSLGQALPSLSNFLSSPAPGAATPSPAPRLGAHPTEWTPKEVDSLTTRVAEAADGTRRIRGIVRALSAFSRGDLNTKGPVDVHRAVESAITLAANEIKHRARLLRAFHPVPMVEADEGRLSQVFLNLLINAAHAIREGDAEHNMVTVRTMVDGSDVVVEVEDTGEGISREVLPRIFEPFFTTKAQGVGLGLGLFVCLNTVRGYSGRIEVWTHPGQGSRFRVHLPGLASVERAAEQSVPPPVSSERAIANLRPRVLVVDDEPMVGLVAQRLLEKECDVSVVHSGAEAQSLLRVDRGFSLVITDLMMPDVSGMDLFDWIGRELPELAPWVVFMTGGAFTERARTFLADVGRPCVDKPFVPRDFRDLVRSTLQKRYPGEPSVPP